MLPDTIASTGSKDGVNETLILLALNWIAVKPSSPLELPCIFKIFFIGLKTKNGYVDEPS
jgi:hypothetical protein